MIALAADHRRGPGFTGPFWAGAAMTAAGLSVLLAADRLGQRRVAAGCEGLADGEVEQALLRFADQHERNVSARCQA